VFKMISAKKISVKNYPRLIPDAAEAMQSVMYIADTGVDT